MTWPTSTAATNTNVVGYYSATAVRYGNWWTAPNPPAFFQPTSYLVSTDRPNFDRLMLLRIPERLPLLEPRSLVALRLERRPELVRRAPRPAGRPSGWRRARKGGRPT